MLRIRVDGGLVEVNSLRELVKIAKEYNLKLLLTARASLELHEIQPKDILKLYKMVNSLNFTTHQSLTDNIRAITLDAYDSVAKDSIIECASLLQEIKSAIIDNPKYFGMLPRKFNTTLIGRETPLINPWSNDLLFALAKKDETYGFNIYVGGKSSEVAKSVDIFVEPNDVKRLFLAILDTYIEHGLRGTRSKVRIFHLIESIGIKKFRELVEDKFGSTLKKEQTLLMKSSKYTLYTPLKNNTFGKVVECNRGEVDLDNLLELLKDNIEIRLGVDQNFHLLNYSNFKEIKSGSITACAGSRYCPLSLWDIKKDVDELNLQKLQKEGISIGFSGCLKGCGRHQHNDIGLIGLRTNMFGPTMRALRVFLGACELPNPAPARLLYYAVPINHIQKLFSAILDEYRAKDYKDFKEFSRHLLEFDIEVLQLWFLIRQLEVVDRELIELFHTKNSQDKLLKYLQNLKIYQKNEDLFTNIKNLSHKLWDEKVA